jgi:hypothetical protein
MDITMKTPRQKYQHDPQYRQLVQAMLAQVHEAQFTPSEIREAAILACIMYEETRIRTCDFVVPDIEESFDNIHKFLDASTTCK